MTTNISIANVSGNERKSKWEKEVEGEEGQGGKSARKWKKETRKLINVPCCYTSIEASTGNPFSMAHIIT